MAATRSVKHCREREEINWLGINTKYSLGWKCHEFYNKSSEWLIMESEGATNIAMSHLEEDMGVPNQSIWLRHFTQNLKYQSHGGRGNIREC